MARRKKAAAPFEVVSQHSLRPPVNVPGTSAAGAGPADTAAEEQPQQAAPQQQPPRRVQPAHPPVAGPQPAPREPEPVVSTTSGRLRLSLNYVSSLVVCGVLILLLVGAFVLGRATAPKAGPTAANNAAQTPTPAPGQDKPRVAGEYYLVIEALPGQTAADKSRAEDIVKFCRERGEYATIETYQQKNQAGQVIRKFYVVWSKRGFDSPNTQAALQHASVVARMGEEYARKTGTRFQFQPNRPGGAWPWFEKL